MAEPLYCIFVKKIIGIIMELLYYKIPKYGKAFIKGVINSNQKDNDHPFIESLMEGFANSKRII